jgi:general secretion pathway protein B
MSFILDALKKSEAERQQQAGAEFAAVPSGRGEPRSLKWLWILIGLLAVNFAVLAGLLLRPAPTPQAPATTPSAAVEAPARPGADAASSFEERVARAREREAERAVDVPEEMPAAQPAPRLQTGAVEQATAADEESAMLPRFDELRAEGVLQLPDLHLDIHVYSDVPAERFAFINMNKLREGQTLAEGPRVESITPSGVVLKYQGTRFLLPRD